MTPNTDRLKALGLHVVYIVPSNLRLRRSADYERNRKETSKQTGSKYKKHIAVIFVIKLRWPKNVQNWIQIDNSHMRILGSGLGQA